jgi:hypothetical protein
MNNWWRPDPPGTINPAKLTWSAGTGAPDSCVASGAACTSTADTLMPPEPTCQSVQSATPIRTTPLSIVPRLPRISSDWDAEHDIVVRGDLVYQASRKEFESCYAAKRRVAAVRSRSRVSDISHRGYFLSQTGDGMRIHVPVDPGAEPGAMVLIHETTSSIYDAYCLHTNITRNVNFFRRHQVCYFCEYEPLVLDH